MMEIMRFMMTRRYRFRNLATDVAGRLFLSLAPPHPQRSIVMVSRRKSSSGCAPIMKFSNGCGW